MRIWGRFLKGPLGPLAILGSFCVPALCTPGALDPTFGNGGVVTRRFSSGEDTYRDVKVLSTGKIMVLAKDGSYQVVLARYNTNGTPDGSFGGGGFVFVNPGATAIVLRMAIQPDGKILVAGSCRISGPADDIMVLRFNVNGSLDASFNGNGKVFLNITEGIDQLFDIRTQPDGKIVVAGTQYRDVDRLSDICVLRINSDGSFDNTFGVNGKVVTAIGTANDWGFGVETLPDGKIVVVGESIDYQAPAREPKLVLARYNVDGSPDTSFGENGVRLHYLGQLVGEEIYPFPTAIALAPDGKLLVPVNIQFFGRAALMRFLPSGEFDTSFGIGGTATVAVNEAYAYDVLLQPDRKIVVIGRAIGSGSTFIDVFAVRLNDQGGFDTSFGTNGRTSVAVGQGTSSDYGWNADLQPDGKIVIVGDYSLSLFDYDALMVRLQGASSRTVFDYDGDAKADISVFRPPNGAWYLQRSTAGFTAISFGNSTDKVTPADFDADGKTDVAVYRPESGTWYWLNSSNGAFNAAQFGASEDLPVPTDYDGDERADLTVFRPSNGVWYRLNSSNGSFHAVAFGASEDKPTLGDFDGDGMADVAVFRPSNGAWYRLNSSNGQFVAVSFGLSDDLTTPADFDGDGTTDVAVYRPSTATWYSLNSTNGALVATQFGSAEDLPTAADYDGDGRADIAVFRPSNGIWYRLNSGNGSFFAAQFGVTGDRPTPTAFRY